MKEIILWHELLTLLTLLFHQVTTIMELRRHTALQTMLWLYQAEVSLIINHQIGARDMPDLHRPSIIISHRGCRRPLQTALFLRDPHPIDTLNRGIVNGDQSKWKIPTPHELKSAR
jgi:hypothetical protein